MIHQVRPLTFDPYEGIQQQLIAGQGILKVAKIAGVGFGDGAEGEAGYGGH
jgi:hypothetical protein